VNLIRAELNYISYIKHLVISDVNKASVKAQCPQGQGHYLKAMANAIGGVKPIIKPKTITQK